MDNNTLLREVYNSDEPLDILYERLNECDNYVDVADTTIIKGQIVWMAYRPMDKACQYM